MLHFSNDFTFHCWTLSFFLPQGNGKTFGVFCWLGYTFWLDKPQWWRCSRHSIELPWSRNHRGVFLRMKEKRCGAFNGPYSRCVSSVLSFCFLKLLTIYCFLQKQWIFNRMKLSNINCFKQWWPGKSLVAKFNMKEKPRLCNRTDAN